MIILLYYDDNYIIHICLFSDMFGVVSSMENHILRLTGELNQMKNTHLYPPQPITMQSSNHGVEGRHYAPPYEFADSYPGAYDSHVNDRMTSSVTSAGSSAPGDHRHSASAGDTNSISARKRPHRSGDQINLGSTYHGADVFPSGGAQAGAASGTGPPYKRKVPPTVRSTSVSDRCTIIKKYCIFYL